MIHNGAFEIKTSRNATKKVHSPSSVYLPHLAMFRKANIKVTKMNTNDKLFFARAKNEKGFYDFSFQNTFEKTEPLHISSFLLQVLYAKLLAKTKL